MVGPRVLEQLNEGFTMQGYNDGMMTRLHNPLCRLWCIAACHADTCNHYVRNQRDALEGIASAKQKHRLDEACSGMQG